MFPDYVVGDLFSKLQGIFPAAEPILALYWQERNGFRVLTRGGERWVPLGEAGAEGWVLKLLSSIIVKDWRKERETLPVSYSLHGTPGAWMATPLVGKEGPLGVLSLSSPLPGAFDEHHLRLLESFASNLTLSLENVLLSERLQKQRRGFELVRKINLQMASASDLKSLIKVALDGLVRLFGASAGWIDLLEQGAMGSPEGVEWARGFLAKALDKGAAVIAEELGSGSPFSSVLSLPLKKGFKKFGAMALAFSTPHYFDEIELYLAEVLAEQIALAVENFALIGEKEQRIRALSLLNDLSKTISLSLNLDEIEITARNFLSRTFPVKAGALYLESAGEMKQVARWGEEPKLVDFISPGIIEERLESYSPFEITGPYGMPTFVAPIQLGNKSMGFILLIGYKLSEEEQLFLSSACSILAGAFHRAYLSREMENRLAEMVTLHAISEQVMLSLELPVVLETIVEIIKHVMDCRAACIFLLNEETGLLEIRASSGITSRWRTEAKLRVGEGISGKVVALGQPIYVPDTLLEPDFIFFDRSVRSILVVPLKVRGKVIGTLSVDHTIPNAFTSDDERFLSIVAVQAAIAIENATLYERIKEKAEALKKAYDEVSELSRFKSELLQNVSHELRSPLTFIKGYVELLKEKSMGPLTPEQEEALEIVSEKTDIMTRLVEEMIVMQKLEREKLKLEPVSLEEIAHLSVRSATFMAQSAGIEFKIEIPPGLPPVMGDKSRLIQVFDNLINNAIKFSPNGGTITVRLKDMGEYIQAEVEDTGIGIPEDKLDKIFERFYQVDSSSKRQFGGMGLGLAIVKSIVEAHGGKVWARSKLGKGSTFYFVIPKA
ncbi:MAG: GAF domain-containing sensor histidine kinase [Anaerolineae bacterium]|nr:GAF domain-containing protein [Anaerolineae bacterium]MDW8101364.1 GAF domain-containing sensor histidine kinase [Anaerolineae bacterium]